MANKKAGEVIASPKFKMKNSKSQPKIKKRQTKKFDETRFTENVMNYALYKNLLNKNSELFFKFSHNIQIIQERKWDYWTGTDIDLLEIKQDKTIVAYELKGMRKYKGQYEPPRLYEGLDQAFAYLNLPYIMRNSKILFDGGAFDYVYLVHARKKIDFPEWEKRIFNLTPIGFIIMTPDGRFMEVNKAQKNPIQNREAKGHLLENLHTLEKFSINSRIFKKVQKAGEDYFKHE